jgi:TP901 family phage tail tape measure protein
MADFANLVIGLDTSGLKKGEKALADTTKAAGAAEGKLKNASGQFLKAGESADTASRSLDGFGSTTGQVRNLALEAGKAVAALAIGFFSIQTALQAFGDANSLNLALAETNTLLSGLPGEIDLVATSARNLADAYGTSDEEQVRAFYQAFSAGSKDAAEATQLLQAANMLAIGGVTDVTTGVDALSTVVNAFGSDVITAAEASDSLFVAMKAGKTTIGELSASLGQIVPMAAASGVSFDETAAAIAALTTQGLSTSSATTGLRAILSSIIAPTDGAAKAASALGLEFSTQAIKAKGFSGFLDDVIDKTGGSETVIAELFGSVEALGAVLAFSAGAGDKFADILVDMEDKAGSAALAMDAIDASAADRLGDAFQSISNTFTRLAENSLPMAAAAAEVLASSISFVAGSGEALVAVSKILAVVLAGLAVGQIPALIARLVIFSATLSGASIATAAFTLATKAARLALIALGGPIGIVFGLLGAAASAFFLFRDNAGEMEIASYDAEAGSLALAKALNEVTVAEPKSSAAVIALANNNVKLADSAYEAAKAEVEKRRAMLNDANAVVGGGRSRRGEILGSERLLSNANQNLIATETALAKAMSERNNASEEIAMTVPVLVSGTNAITDASVAAKAAAAEFAKKLDDLDVGAYGAASSVEKLTPALTDAEKAAKQVAQLRQELTDAEWADSGLKPFIEDLSQAGLSMKSLADVFQNAIARMAQSWLSSGLTSLGQSFMGIGGGQSGGVLSGLIGSIPSFSGGGFTGNGARSGGLDGQGGFLALNHPKETIIDHTRSQSPSQAPVINITVNGARGNAEIVEMVGIGVSAGIQQNNKRIATAQGRPT